MYILRIILSKGIKNFCIVCWTPHPSVHR